MAWWQVGEVAGKKRQGRKLPKRKCPACGRMVSIMSRVRPNEVRAHSCASVNIRGKLGTHPTAVYFVRSTEGEEIEGPPSVGDVVNVRSDMDQRVIRWTSVLVNEIRFGNFFFMEMY